MIKLALTVFSISTFAFPALASDGNKVIYGKDDRKDVYQSTNETHKMLAKSTAAMIPNDQVVTAGGILDQITGVTLKKYVQLCSSENFGTQLAAADCSGFLVSDTHLVTAGHCITNSKDCASNKWVFDFAYETEDNALKTEFFVDTSKVYSCRKIIERSLGNGSRDFAVIELDRPVTDRQPLKFRTSGKIEVGTPLVVIGHPTGIPTKITDGANVQSTSPIEFTADLDTFGGNSGSAVFNDLTGEVEGILVRGATDYVIDKLRGCRVPNKCKNITGTEKCRGETITKITGIKMLDPNLRPPTEAQIVTFLEKEPTLVEDFAANIYKNCLIKTNNPKYNQLYVNGQFKGNYTKNVDDQKLKSGIALLVMNGTCVKRGPSDPNIEPTPAPVRPQPVVTPRPRPTQAPAPVVIQPTPVPTPVPVPVPLPTPVVISEPVPEVITVIDPMVNQQLIQDVMGRMYAGCRINELPQRHYYQLYVGPSFRGNFIMERQDHELAETLRSYIDKKVCVLK